MRLFVFTMLLAACCCSEAVAKSKLVVDWEGMHIRMDEPGPWSTKIRPRNQYSGSPIVDCVFNGMKAQCIKIKRTRRDGEGYGYNLKFVQAVAVLPNHESKGDGDNNSEKIARAYEKGDNPRFVASLPQFKFRTLTADAIDKAPDDEALIGLDSQDWTFSEAGQTIGGDYALEVWKSLIGKLPKRECAGGGYPCNVVTAASKDGNEAIVRCDVENSALGIGLPHSCQTMAFRKSGVWFVYSYDGPQQCDGCGAGGETECEVSTNLPLGQIASAVVEILQQGRTNISLKPLSETNETVRLIGRNVGTPSKFYAGYFDRSYAAYTISRSASDQNRVTIYGTFNLLISVEQSSKGIDYRDIGNGKDQSDMDWFQNQVLETIKAGLSQKLKVKLSCDQTAL